MRRTSIIVLIFHTAFFSNPMIYLKNEKNVHNSINVIVHINIFGIIFTVITTAVLNPPTVKPTQNALFLIPLNKYLLSICQNHMVVFFSVQYHRVTPHRQSFGCSNFFFSHIHIILYDIRHRFSWSCAWWKKNAPMPTPRVRPMWLTLSQKKK